ncbi:hypothetical protein [Ensifer sp. LCM 4579]|nr:hypothetical protein [Ensifer sp. LCM 4579]
MKRSTQSRTICSVTLPIRAASDAIEDLLGSGEGQLGIDALSSAMNIP